MTTHNIPTLADYSIAEKNVVDLDELRRKLGPKQSLLFGDTT